MENKASKGPRSLGRGQGMSSENPECQPGLVWHPEGKRGWCPKLGYPQEPWRKAVCGGESEIAEVTARMGLNLQELKVSRSLDQLVQNNHTCSGGPCFNLHSASLAETYSAEEDLSPRLQLCSDTRTQCSNYRRQNIQHIRKKGIK